MKQCATKFSHTSLTVKVNIKDTSIKHVFTTNNEQFYGIFNMHAAQVDIIFRSNALQCNYITQYLEEL